jgi:K+-transporting ATPase KdpF subunit
LSVFSAENWIGLIGGVLLTIYLFVALILPERF